MSLANQTHPAPDRLRAFALGQLAPAELAELERHVGSCSECCAQLGNVPDDTFLDRLRNSPSPDTDMPDQAAIDSKLDLPNGLADHPRYRVVRLLGAGGMGVVYQAVHRMMEREVALKVINPGLVSHPVALERFLQEVKTAAKLAHPNIVAAHDAEQVGGVHFLVMEYVDGISLDRLVAKQGPLPAAQACHFIRQAAVGLQHAHEKGMVHRDIKPHNLMVTRKGQVKVLDFGLARLVQEQASDGGKRPLTTLGVVLGTPDYIAPEQVNDSRKADIRSDIYSLGCTLYFLLAGQPPFPEGNALSKAISHLESLPAPLRTLRQDLPPELMPVIDRMMAKSPDDRYRTPAEVAQALQPFARLSNSQPSRMAAPIPAPRADTAPVPQVKVETQPVPVPEPKARSQEKPRRKKKVSRQSRRGLLIGLALGLAGLLSLGAALAIGVPKLGWGKGKLGLAGSSKPRVLIVLPHQKFWWGDYEPVRRVLTEDGVEVVVCSSKPDPAQPDGGGQPVKVDITIDRAKGKDYDAIIFTGSYHKPEYVKDGYAVADARRLIGEMMSEKKLVTGLCTGTVVLGEAGVLNGKKATGHGMAKWVLMNNGAEFVDEEVVESGNLITGRDAKAADAFARRVLARLKEKGR